MNKDYVYLTVDGNGVTKNVFATLGMAIDAIEMCEERICEELITERTITSLKWNGRDGNEYSLEIKKCPICTDVRVDYMNEPRAFVIVEQ
jgi:hypothetical protein